MHGSQISNQPAWRRVQQYGFQSIEGNWMTGKTSSGRFTEVDVLRAFAVGIVMVHHFYSEKFFLAGFGVTLFFVLSSFFATNSLLRLKDKIEAGQMRRVSGFTTFYIRRWLRIWPLYYL